MTKPTIALLVLLLPIACENAEAKKAAPQTTAATPTTTAAADRRQRAVGSLRWS